MSASTGGSARPSFSPDSRFSECRTLRGTRGLVTTLDDSTGSVGESSAPTRKLSVQLRSVTHVGGHGHEPGGDRHRQHELAEREVPGRLEHLGLDLEAVAEQDQDQRDDGHGLHEAAARVELEHLEPALPEREAGEHEDRGQRQEAAAGDPGDQRAEDQQPAEDGRAPPRAPSDVAEEVDPEIVHQLERLGVEPGQLVGEEQVAHRDQHDARRPP